MANKSGRDCGFALIMVLTYIALIGLFAFSIQAQVRMQWLMYHAWDHYWQLQHSLAEGLQYALTMPGPEKKCYKASHALKVCYKTESIQRVACVHISHSNVALFSKITVTSGTDEYDQRQLIAYSATPLKPTHSCQNMKAIIITPGLQSTLWL